MRDHNLAGAMPVRVETVHAETAETIIRLLTGTEPVTVVLEGSKGSGKTTLAAGVMRALDDRFMAHTVRGTAPGKAMGLFAIEHLLTDGAGSVVEAADNLPALLGRFTATIRAQSAGALPVLWVDNVELLDPQSAALLAMLAGTGSIRMLATCRSIDDVDAFKSLRAEGLIACRSVPALEPEQSRQVLESRLEGPVASAMVCSLHAFAGGNPLMLRLLADHARENGMLHRDQGAWNVSGHLVESMTAGSLSAGMRILAGDLTPSELNAAEILAAAGHVDINHLLQFIDGSVLEAMCDRGVITLGRGRSGDTEATLANDALGHIIRQTMPRDRAGKIWEQTVTPAGSEHAARPTAGQLLWAARLDLGVTDTQLTAAADEALFACHPGVAERLLGYVSAETAPVVRLQAEARYLLGDGKRAAVLVEEAVSRAQADGDVATLALAALLGLLLGTRQEAVAIAGFAALESMLSLTTSGDFRRVIATYDESGFDGGGVGGWALGDGGLDSSADGIDPTGEANDTAAGGAGTPHGPVAEIPWLSRVLCAQACAIVGEQERAAELIEAALAVQGGIRSAVLAGRALTVWCRVLFLAGNWETCRQVFDAERRVRPGRMLHSDGELEALEALVTHRAGGSAGALSRSGSGLDGFGSFVCAAAGAAGAAGAADAAGATGATGMSAPVVANAHRELAGRHGVAREAGPRVYIAGTVVLHAMGVGDAGSSFFGVPEPELKQLLRLAETNEGHLAARYGALAAGLLGADAAALLEAARLGRAAGDELLAAKAAAAAASLAGRKQDRDVMREAQGIIADPSQPSSYASGVLDGLTGRERQVASLAASGSSNADIGAALTISVRTAERHLQNAYDKLGVRGRAELADAMEAELAGVAGA
ncbi:helix-turn-helix transcriptional regulator [Arthrobacter castelli]|uniref:helix-turn-helix transcriptional regulator n=1 Tax=Arthrobacter castelli TaxID=271431 RepID=UPI0003F72FE8|nr:LuxR C-terminal-related transcriptional regulator [Arthrobacter castelli]